MGKGYAILTITLAILHNQRKDIGSYPLQMEAGI